MAFANDVTRELHIKLVYCGPGSSGKKTNLLALHRRAAPGSAGRLIRLAAFPEEGLYFDLVPGDLGAVGRLRPRFHLHAAPGQAVHEAARRLVLQGADGVVFVADSDPLRLDATVEAWRSLLRHVAADPRGRPRIACVLQFNKRDIPGAVPVEDLRRELAAPGVPGREAVARLGEGVWETLRDAAVETLRLLRPLLSDRPESIRHRASEAGSPGEQPRVASTDLPGPARTGEARRTGARWDTPSIRRGLRGET
ncbi:MAG: gliding-motility protein MglA [Deferrisomatales bacterium]|nr:gliding-motility protein MglA [Deferrisomatales bacterium]